MKLKPQQRLYFKKAVDDLIDTKIDLHFSRTRKVEDCGGYFCPATKSLKVAIWNKEWFSIFIHEYNHYKQWKKKTKLWTSVEDIDFFTNFPKRYVLSTQLMEQECDKMVVKDINDWGIEGMNNYISESNSYHISYLNMVGKKKFPVRAPFRFSEITDLCPNDRFFNINELQKPQEKLFNLIDKNCF